MKITIDTKKFNEALHHITRAITILQDIREEFLESILDTEEEEKNNENTTHLV